MDPENVGHSARAVSDAGAFVERAAHATRSSNSSFARVGAAVSAVRLGARLLPAARRLFRRHPLAGTLLVVGVIGGLYLTRSARPPRRF